MRPKSLISGESASARRAYSNLTTTTDEPTGAGDGLDTRGARWLHLVFKLPDPGAQVTLKVFLWDRASEEWTLERRLGAQGEYTLEGAVRVREILEIARLDRVAVQVVATSGTLTEGVSLWMAGVS